MKPDIKKQSQLYDIYVVNPIRGPHDFTAGTEFAKERGYIKFGKTLSKCRAIIEQVHRQSGGCYVIPIKYREVKVVQAAALEVARKKYDEYVAQGGQLGDMYEVFDYLLWWTFQAEDGIRDAQESRGLGDVYKRQPPCTGTLVNYSPWSAITCQCSEIQ